MVDRGAQCYLGVFCRRKLVRAYGWLHINSLLVMYCLHMTRNAICYGKWLRSLMEVSWSLNRKSREQPAFVVLPQQPLTNAAMKWRDIRQCIATCY